MIASATEMLWYSGWIFVKTTREREHVESSTTIIAKWNESAPTFSNTSSTIHNYDDHLANKCCSWKWWLLLLAMREEDFFSVAPRCKIHFLVLKRSDTSFPKLITTFPLWDEFKRLDRCCRCWPNKRDTTFWAGPGLLCPRCSGTSIIMLCFSKKCSTKNSAAALDLCARPTRLGCWWDSTLIIGNKCIMLQSEVETNKVDLVCSSCRLPSICS